MKIQTLKLPNSGSAIAPSKSPTLARAVAVSPPKPKPGSDSGIRQNLAGEERRRSQRVLLRVRASIHVALQGKRITFEAWTLSVNTQGAMLVLTKGLPIDTRLVLEHGATKERVACRVARPSKEMPEGFHVPVEFDSPAPDFWKIAFPPADWRPYDEM